MSSDFEYLREKYDIIHQFDDPEACLYRGSFYGNGRYPPDWDRRRDAIWDYQRYQCGRCGIYIGDAESSNVHHVKPLSKGGKHQLKNLVGLCGNCHAVIHPKASDIEGNPYHANIFPDEYADPRVAVIREPFDNDNLKTDLERLAEISNPDENEISISEVVIPTSSSVAKQANEDLYSILTDHGFVPRSADYHRIRVSWEHRKLRGFISQFEPAIRVSAPGGPTVEKLSSEQIHQYRDILLTVDASWVIIEIHDTDDKHVEKISLGNYTNGANLNVKTIITPPPILFDTISAYTRGLFLHVFIYISFGFIPAILISHFSPSVVPLKGIVGIAILSYLLPYIVIAPLNLKKKFNQFRRDTIEVVDKSQDSGG